METGSDGGHATVMLWSNFSSTNVTPLTEDPIAWALDEVLSLVTVVISSVSLVGLIFAFITYSLFSDVRSLAGTTLMNLLAALFLLQLLFVVGIHRPKDARLCLGLVLALHGLGLSVFAWLVAMTHDLYISSQETVSSLRPFSHASAVLCRNFCRYSMLAWGFPAACTCLAASLQLSSTPIHDRSCWLCHTAGLTYAFALPLAVMSLLMAVFAVRAAIVVRCVAGMQDDRKWSRKWSRRRYLQLALYVKIYVLVASVWLCGVGARATGTSVLWVAFQLLFSSQGVLVAVAYTCNGRVFKIYSHAFGPRKSKGHRYYGASGDLSRSASLQLLSWDPPPNAV